jgi:hypothetical protein
MTRRSAVLRIPGIAAAIMVACVNAAAAQSAPIDGAAAISIDGLRDINPAVAAHYALISPCVPNMGVHYGAVVAGRPANAPSVILSVDPVNGQVTAMELIVPADMPWQPWFDQPEGEPMEIMAGMKVWTQHVFLVDPATINPCPPPSND